MLTQHGTLEHPRQQFPPREIPPKRRPAIPFFEGVHSSFKRFQQSPLYRREWTSAAEPDPLPLPTPGTVAWLSKQRGCRLGSLYLTESKGDSKGQNGQKRDW